MNKVERYEEIKKLIGQIKELAQDDVTYFAVASVADRADSALTFHSVSTPKIKLLQDALVSTFLESESHAKLLNHTFFQVMAELGIDITKINAGQ